MLFSPRYDYRVHASLVKARAGFWIPDDGVQIGLDTYSFHLAFGAHGDFCPADPRDLPACLERAAEIGFGGVQIDPLHLPVKSAEALRQIRRRADDLQLFLEAGMKVGQAFLPDRSARNGRPTARQ